MNKKFSTLVASLLLAGGLFTSAFAQEKINLSDAAKQGGYYSLKMSDNATIEKATKHIIVRGGKLVLDNVKTGTPTVAAGFWTATKVNVNGTEGYAFVNAEGVKLTFDAKGNFQADGKGVYNAFTISNAQLYPIGAEAKKLGKDSKGNVALVETSAKYTTVFTVATDDVTADVDNLLGDGFSLTIGKQVKNKKGEIVWDGAYENLKGNVFTGKLTTKKVSGNKYQLQNEEGKYIVLTNENWGNLSNSLQGTGSQYDGFKFAAMSEAQIKNAEKGTILAQTFTITQPNMVTNEPLEVVAGEHYELMVAIVDGQAYLTTGDANAANSEEYLTGKASYTYEENTSKKVINNTYVIFGDGNDVDYAIFKDAVWNISWTNKANETLVAGPQCGKYPWVPAAQVATAYPEGQWLYQGGNTFVNRESGNTMSIAGLRKIEGKELTFSNSEGTFTFVQAGVPGHVTDAYLNGTDDEFLKEAFHIASPLAYGDTVYLAKDEKNALYLTKDKAEAVEFRMKKEDIWENAKNPVNHSDLIRHYTTYASAKSESGFATDTLSLHRYFVSEASTNMYLSYDYKNEKYILSETDGDNAIIFKNKAEKLYNLVQNLDIVAHNNDKKEFLHWEFINDWFWKSNKWTEDKNTKAFCAASKLYGAHNSAELKKAVSAYEFIANDLFTLTKVDAGQHVSGIEGDTIKIFRNIDNNYVLYESGKLLADAKGDAIEGFLAIQNFLDPKYADKNAAMYVDGAAGLDTWRPEYMLVLDAKKVDAQNDLCSICGKPTCEHSHVSRGYVEGRYLVNLVDSAKAGRKDCVFQNYGNQGDYYRLGFVHAKHIGDSLVIASSNDTLNLTGNDFFKTNVCEFAFHYVDKAREAFTIETAYEAYRATKEDVLAGYGDYVGELLGSTRGWVKFHNGIPVVTKQKDEAEVFNLELTSENPTANEEVAVSEVSVVAVDGAVVVKGAAGKAVAISNILGQTIANTVIASDNETIAVPAGIVVVAVEGEEAVKAIVR